MARGEAVGCPGRAGPACDLVFSRSRAFLFHLPLPLLGYTAYAAAAFLLLGPLVLNQVRHGPRRESWRGRSPGLLLALTLAMVLFSLDLVRVLGFELGAACPWCIASASLSVLLFLGTVFGFSWSWPRDWRALLGGGLVGIGAIGLGSMAGGSGVFSPPLEVRANSRPEAVRLAEHLRKTGARFYGSRWCEHCWQQKELFGREATELLPYVECADQPPPPGIELFPTWQIGKQRLPGVQSLELLAALSGFPWEWKDAASGGEPDPERAAPPGMGR